MIKYVTIIFTLAFLIGCKSPVSDNPMYVMPDENVGGNENVENVVPPTPLEPPITEEVPFIPPSGYIGEGGETNVVIDVVSENLHVAFSNSSRRIKIDAYKDNEWVFVDSNTEQVQDGAESPIAITHVGDTPYVIFADGKANGLLRFKTFNGSAWVDVTDTKHLSGNSAPFTSIVSIGSDIYMAFSGYGETGRNITVKKYDTVKKDLTDLPSPYLKQASKIQLFDVDSKLHIAYKNADGTGIGYTYNAESSTWEPLGEGSGTAKGIIHNAWGVATLRGASINDIPHAMYQAYGALTLTKFEDGKWTQVSQVTSQKTSEMDFIVIDDVPFVAYYDTNESTLRVQKLTEGAWRDVDRSSPFVSDGEVKYVDMAYDNGILYVAFQDLSSEGAGRIKIVSFEL